MHVNYRIGGAVWGNKVQYEPLTDTMNLLPLWQQGPVLLRLVRQMQAFCLCVKELLAEYSVQPPGIRLSPLACTPTAFLANYMMGQGLLALLQDNICMQHESKSAFCFV